MKALQIDSTVLVKGGLLDQGNGSGAGSSESSFGTSAIKGDTQKARRDINKASAYVAVVSSIKAPYVSMAAGLVNLITSD